MHFNRPVVLTIAGSDSSAGAGIQADLKAIEAVGGYAVTAVTAVTAQSRRGVRRIERISHATIRAQLDAIFDDFTVAAVKTGMLVDGEVVELIADVLAARRPPVIVCDPVVLSTSGAELLDGSGVESLRDRLLPLCSLVTPNVPEAARLSGIDIREAADAEHAARRILATGVGAVLVTGGHHPSEPGTDLLVDGRGTQVFPGRWVDTPSTHGTGCVLASALATRLALGDGLPEAVARAKELTTCAIEQGAGSGDDAGPIDPLFNLRSQ